MDSMRFAATLIVVACLVGGCSSTSSYRASGVDFGTYKSLWVEKNLADDHGINEMIASELRSLGFEASTGPSTMMPRGIEAIVTYTDEWTWDFKTYLIDIEITVRDARSPRILAKERYFRPGITNKAPATMVREVVQSVFKPGKG